MSNFYETLKAVLLQDDRLVAQDGTLLRNRAFELGAQMDVLLIRLLLNHSVTKKHFFTFGPTGLSRWITSKQSPPSD